MTIIIDGTISRIRGVFRFFLKFCPTTIAAMFVNAKGPPARGAGPPSFLIFEEALNTVLFEIVQILDHAHVVLGAIAGIDVGYFITGHFLTFKTEFCHPKSKFVAVFDLAFFASDRLMRIRHPASQAFVFDSQVCVANATIHPARTHKGN